jgi:hypothetical protein
MTTTKPNQVAFTLGEDNINLLEGAYRNYGCKSRSELMKKIIEDWIFSNKPLILLLRKNGK